MTQRKNFLIAKKIIISLTLKLRTFDNQFPELSLFIRELENIDFAANLRLVEPMSLPNEVLEALNSICLNSKYQLDGLDHVNISNLTWMNIYEGMESKNLFVNGMFASRLLGLDGYLASTHISSGLMLILPGVIYPLHTHLIKEFYYCLSGELLIQHDIDGEKFSLVEGEISITPEGKLHSLEVVGETPVLLVYSWLGNLNTPIRMWEKIKSGQWEGCVWKRLPGQKWKSSDLKKLSEKKFFESFSKND